MKRIISMIVLFGFSLLLFSQELLYAIEIQKQKYTLAVLPFEAQDRVSDSQALQLGDVLASELAQYDIFRVKNLNQTNQVLEANDIDPLKCSTKICAIEAGKILGTRLVAKGTVRKAGPLYFLEVSIIHVFSGKTVQYVKDEFQGNFGQLKNHMKVVAQKLVGMKPGSARAVGQTRATEPVATPQETAVSTSEESAPGEEQPIEISGSESQNLRKGGKGKWLVLGLLVAGGIGAGVYYSQQNKTNTGSGTNTQTTILPVPPTFP